MSILQKISVGLLSAVGGAGVVVAAFRYSALNWIVDGPGWIVGRFLPIDFHEGEGALGFFLAIVLSWICSSLALFSLVYLVAKTFGGRRS
jgi:hypothetical protein